MTDSHRIQEALRLGKSGKFVQDALQVRGRRFGTNDFEQDLCSMHGASPRERELGSSCV